MQLYNTLGRTKQEFTPIDGKTVKLYTCGPTVYHYAHIGNLRNVIFNDTLKRSLLLQGWKVRHVMNITDVGHLVSDGDEGGDKLEQGAAREGRTPQQIAQFYTDAFNRNTTDLNVLEPTVVVPATAAIPAQIDLIKRLIDSKHAYVAEQAIYFDVSTISNYGKLTGQNLEDKQTGVRDEVVKDSQKRNPQDFAIWFFLVGHHKDHSQHWKSPWGEGFPGWHLECSAIIHQELGEPIDIHTGGVDHIGTHHTNEIAQSEAGYGQELAKFWLHNEFLQVDGQKMAKSGGNGYILDDITGKGYDPLNFRLMMLQAHYRTQQNFTWAGLRAASNLLTRLRAFADLQHQQPDGELQWQDTADAITAALADDLNTPEALAALMKLIDQHDKQPTKGVSNLAGCLSFLDQAFGLNLSNRPDLDAELKGLVAERESARRNQNFEAADKLRKKLVQLGVDVTDTPEGARWGRRGA